MKVQKSAIPFTLLLLLLVIGLPYMDYRAKQITKKTVVIKIDQQAADAPPLFVANMP